MIGRKLRDPDPRVDREYKAEKLLYVMNHYSPTGSSHFSHVFSLLEAMADQGTRVLVLIERAEEVPRLEHPNLQIRCMGQSGNGPLRWLRLVAAVSSAISDGYRTVFIRISVWSALASILAARGGRGTVFFWQSGTTIEFDRAQPWSGKKLRWWLRSRIPALLVWRMTDRFVTGPVAMANYYATVGGVAREKIRLLFNDVDHRRFAWTGYERIRLRRSLRTGLALPANTVILLFVHRLSPVRRTLDYLPLALERSRDADVLRNTCLLVVGDGPDLPELRSRCQKAGFGANVRFLGELPNHGIEQLYAGADIFLQPSHAEGFPRVLLEAMVSGLSVVTTDAGGSAEILGPHQQRYVASKDDPEGFASCLVALLSDPNSWPELAAENIEKARAYDTPTIAEMYRRVLFGE